jgi:hypothetical protein
MDFILYVIHTVHMLTINTLTTNALNKIQFMTSIGLLHVSAAGCHPGEVFKNKGINEQHANLGTPSPAP